jgi:DNA-binding response OmpR family regulator
VVSSLRNQGFKKLIIGLSAGNTNEEGAALLDAGADCVINKQLHAAQVDAIEKFVRVCSDASADSGNNHIASSGKYIVDKKSRKDYVIRRV